MKKLVWILAVCCTFFIGLGLAGCFGNGGGGGGGNTNLIKFDATVYDYTVGKEYQLGWDINPQVYYYNAAEYLKSFTFEFAENTADAKVSMRQVGSDGWGLEFHNAFITAEKEGTAVLTVKCNYNGFWQSEPITFHFTYVSVSDAESLLKLPELGNSTANLTADIDLGGAEWAPIDFEGTLIGNGHTISNFTLSENRDTLGFFGTLSGTVSDLKFADVAVSLRGSKSDVGIIAGVNTGTIELCEVSGSVQAEYAANVGGIAGRNSGGITACVNNAEIVGGSCVGGITGFATGEISECTNNGEITGSERTGGIAGERNNCSVENCKNYAAIGGGDYTGGIFGYISSGSHQNIENEGSVVGKNYTGGIAGYWKSGSGETAENFGNITGTYYVGGLYGYATSADIIGYTNRSEIMGRAYVGGVVGYGGSLTDCKNEGAIISTGVLPDGSAVYSYVGGVAGRSGGLVNCSNTADISASGLYVGGVAGYVTGNIDGAVNEGSVTGGESCGGIAGHLEGNISEAENYGDVAGEDYTGGIVGHYSNAVEAEVCTNSGEVRGNDYTGGLFGGGELYSIIHSIVIIACDNFGDVTGKDYTGGFIGYASAGSILDAENIVAVTGHAYMGGIAGYFGGNLSGCTNRGEIASAGVSVESGKSYSYVGGVAGYCNEIDRAENFSDISAEGLYTGGVAGFVYYNVTEAINDGDVRGSDYCGGVAGYVGQTVSDSTNNGNIQGNNHCGGVAGQAGSLIGCINNGSVTAKDFIGGIGGEIYADRPTNGFQLTGNQNSGEIVGENYTGGILGRLNIVHDDEQWDSPIQTNTNRGTVTARNNYAGGIVGGTCGSPSTRHYISDYTATVNVVSNSNQSSISATGSYAGGIFGFIEGLRSSYWNGYRTVYFQLAADNTSIEDIDAQNYSSVLYGYKGSYVL